MFSPKWIKWDPRAALVGMQPLSVEERGVYITLLNLIYCRGGHIDDDDPANAQSVGVPLRVYRRVKERLTKLQKLSTAGGKLYNERAAQECDAAQHRALTSTNLANRRWAKYKIDPNLFKDLPNAKAHANAHAKAYAIQNKKERDNSDSEIGPTQTPATNGHSSVDPGDFGSPAGSLATALPTGALARLPRAETNSKLKPLAVSPQLEAIIKARGWDDD